MCTQRERSERVVWPLWLASARTRRKKRGCTEEATSVAAKGQGGVVKCLLARRIILLLTGERLRRTDFKPLLPFVECHICFVPRKATTGLREILSVERMYCDKRRLRGLDMFCNVLTNLSGYFERIRRMRISIYSLAEFLVTEYYIWLLLNDDGNAIQFACSGMF